MGKRLRIMFLRTEYYGAVTTGGVASMYNGIIGGLQSLGHECVFVSSGPLELPDGVSSYYVPYSGMFMNFPEVLNLPYNAKIIRRLREIIDIEQPDLLIQHNHDFTIAGSEIHMKTGLPFFLHCDAAQQWVKANWGKLYLKKIHTIAELMQFEAADRLLAPSNAVKRQLVRYGADERKIVVNPNACDPDVFSDKTDGSAIRRKYNMEDRFVVGFLGTFGPWHGVDELARAIPQIIERVPEAMIFFVGDGTLRPQVEEIIDREGVRDHVIITGMIGHSEVPPHLAACDVLTSPTVQNPDRTEFFGSPTKLFEYMAMGRPVVASAVGQIAEVIEHGKNGLLTAERSPDDLAEKIIYIYNNPEKAAAIGRSARDTVISNYTWRSNAKRIIAAYHGI
ncbi:MAG: glycosyltransferase family 4 protein [Candidatus Kapaibacterium sp.]